MRKWLHDRPWIWIVLLLGFLVAAGLTVVVIAEMNRPEIVKEKRQGALTVPAPTEDNPSWAAVSPMRKGRVV